MTGSEPPRTGRTLTFGGPDDGEGESSALGLLQMPMRHPAQAPGPRAASRAAARRARQRRRAAQRRSRVRLRDGSEAGLAFLVLLGLTLLLVDVRTEGSAFAGARSVAAGVVGPMQAGIADALDPAEPDWDLIAENEALLAELAASAPRDARLAELESLLGIVGGSGHDVVAASVVALDSGAGAAQTATLDRGTSDSIGVDHAVIAAGGLAGRIVNVAASSAVVRLASDPQFVVGGRLAESGEVGIVRGTGDPGLLTMDLLDPLVEVKIGDTVSTSGSPGGTPFPAGLAIGEVLDLGDPGDSIRVLLLRPLADLTTLSVMAVVRPPDVPSRAPIVTGPAANGPDATGPAATGPDATGPAATGPDATGPGASGPDPSGPGASGLPGSEPAASGPSASGPSASGPSASGPSATGPSASGPSASGPSANGPGASGPPESGPPASGPATPRPLPPGPDEREPVIYRSAEPGPVRPAASETEPLPDEPAAPAPAEPVPAELAAAEPRRALLDSESGPLLQASAQSTMADVAADRSTEPEDPGPGDVGAGSGHGGVGIVQPIVGIDA